MNRIIWQDVLLCHHLGSRDWLKWYGDCWSGWKIGQIAFKFRRIYKWLKTRQFPCQVRSLLWLYDPRYKDIRTCSHGRWPSLFSAGGQDLPNHSTCSSLSSLISSSSLLRYVLVHLHFVLTEEDEYMTLIVLCSPAVTVSICVRSWNWGCYWNIWIVFRIPTKYNAVSVVTGFVSSEPTCCSAAAVPVCVHSSSTDWLVVLPFVYSCVQWDGIFWLLSIVT